jgi:phosphotransferase system, enzyme I, PtsP
MRSILNHIISEANCAPSVRDALDVIVKEVAKWLAVEACSVFLCDDDSAEYVLVATQGLNSEAVGKARVKFGEGLISVVGEREEPLNLQDVSSHPAFRRLKMLHEENFKSFLGVPIIHKGQLQGVIVLQQLSSDLFTEEQISGLITLTTQIAEKISVTRDPGVMRALFHSRRRKKKLDTVLAGIPGGVGVAIGRIVVVYPPADLDSVPDRDVVNVEQDLLIFESALAAARLDLEALKQRSAKTLSVAENALFDAYLRILDSRTLVREVEQEVKSGQWAQGALKLVINRYVAQFELLDDEYLRERATDFKDLGRRILAHMQASTRVKPVYPNNTILVSEDLTATQLMEVPEGKLAGVISGSGSSNSHVAIIARALGLPSVMGVKGFFSAKIVATEVVVDGYHGQIYLSPSTYLKAEFKALIAEEQELGVELAALRDLPAKTQDGHVLSLYVNTGLVADGGVSLSVGADGVGLYRTEMPFMLRDSFPTQAEQAVMYKQLLNTFKPRPVVMRTLDIGGDKQLSYFPIKEENPFLGWRGVRVTLDHPEIFLQQVRAMLEANKDMGNLSIMLPMISSVNELEKSLRLIDQAYAELSDEIENLVKPPVGIMIEVPAAVYQGYDLARRVDFVSVGTNDLIQYLLAVDRNNPRVAAVYDGLHPAVLRALNDMAKAARKANKPISICGELASDPLAVILLLGMGYLSLSVSASVLLRVKWVVRNVSLEFAKKLLKEVLLMDDVIEVRRHMEMVLDDMGLGGLIRAGK